MDAILAKANQLKQEETLSKIEDAEEEKSDIGLPTDEQRQRRKPVDLHLTVGVPLIELLIISR